MLTVLYSSIVPGTTSVMSPWHLYRPALELIVRKMTSHHQRNERHCYSAVKRNAIDSIKHSYIV